MSVPATNCAHWLRHILQRNRTCPRCICSPGFRSRVRVEIYRPRPRPQFHRDSFGYSSKCRRRLSVYAGH
jgi:hypothetical protein